ncbi:MAG TPA: membrane protein insertase YidC [Candidatus Acidoferrum sp.]|nr:membrane protein insertase YidC [Candidatus Acidoferrum sp.]
MDRTGIIVVSLCVVLLGIWFVEQNKVAMEQARYAATNRVAHLTVTNLAALSNQLNAAVPPAGTPGPGFDTNQPESLLVTNYGRARYTFTSRGGGLKSVELLDYPETISPRWKRKVATDGVATLNMRAPLPVLAVLGDPGLFGDGNFTLGLRPDGVLAEKTLTNGLRLTKEFHLSSNYLVNTTVRLENPSETPFPLPVQEWVIGTATPMGPDDNALSEGVMWFDGRGTQDRTVSWFSGTGFGCFRGTPRSEYVAGSNDVVWAAAHNQFFALMAMPKDPAEQIVARPVNLPPFPNVEPIPGAPPPQGVQTAFVYPAVTLAAHSALERHIVLFAGPKEYRLLARIGDEFQNQADLVMQFGKYLGFFAKALLLAMNWLHDVTRLGYGWVIVLITVLIKVVFWPLTAASTRSMKRMQALAPEMQALKEKYGDDMQKLTQKQWELYRKHKVSPMSGCLPMAIQMPVFIGFFTMIRSAIELRGAHFLWIADLSKPDTIFMIPGINFPFNPLPLLMGGAMLWQSHLTPPSPGMDPAQAKIMRYMPLLFLVFLYNYSSGLALYWTVNNVLTIVQTKLTKMNQPAAGPAPQASGSALTPASKRKK